MFVSITQVIGCEDRLRNDLYCVEWGVKLYSIHPYMRCLMTAEILKEHFSIICFCFLWLGIGRRIYSIVVRYALSLVRYLFTASQKCFLDILSVTWPSIVPFQYFLADILGIKLSKDGQFATSFPRCFHATLQNSKHRISVFHYCFAVHYCIQPCSHRSILQSCWFASRYPYHAAVWFPKPCSERFSAVCCWCRSAKEEVQ